MDFNNSFCLLFFSGTTASNGTTTITLPVTVQQYLAICITAQTLGRWVRMDSSTRTTINVLSSSIDSNKFSQFVGFVICTI